MSLPEFVQEVAKDDPTYPAWYEKKERYIEQQGELVVPELDDQHRQLVIRGQHRLVEGRRVRIVNGSSQVSTTARRPARPVTNSPR